MPKALNCINLYISVATGKFVCEFCSQKFETRSERNTHILAHFTRKLCSICNSVLLHIGDDVYVLHSTKTCIPHNLGSDKFDENTNVSNESIVISQECCDFDSENNDKLEEIHSVKLERETIESDTNSREQVQLLEKPKNFQPIVSKRNQRTRIQSQKKSVTKHSEPNLSMKNKNIKRFKCEFEGCGQMISSNQRGSHKAKHIGARFECDICAAKFVTKSQIRVHILNVHDPKSKKFKCDICGSSYLYATLLANHHKLSHLKERNFMCSECGKTFQSKHLLQEHGYGHTGEKPFECSHDGCSKRFRTKAQRVEHFRSHSGEKPFKCIEQGCHREFAYAVDFRRHKYKSHGIFTNKFPCQICSEIFPENMLLKKHMKKHNIQP